MTVDVVTDLERLREVALDQYGYVTTAQALEAGVPHAQLSKMVARGRLARVAHGVYQVPQVPATQYGPFMLAVLWTGAPEACLSHDTALAAWDVSDINPTAIHLTVARHRRVTRAGGDGYVLHHQDLDDAQRTWWEGIPIVTAGTTIAQCIDTGVPTYLVRQALERGRRTGLLTTADHDDLAAKLEARHG